MPIQRLSHVGLCVADLQRALRFYRDALGFRVEGELSVAGAPNDRLLGVADPKLHAVYLQRDGVRLELLHFEAPGTLPEPAPRPMNRAGLTHLSFRVDDVDAAVAAVCAAGGRLLADTRIAFPERGVGAVFVLDPDGQRIELFQSPGDPDAAPGTGGAR